MLRDVPMFHLFDEDQLGELCQHIPDGRAESEVAPFQKTGAEIPALALTRFKARWRARR
jgi:hypothetical protein